MTRGARELRGLPVALLGVGLVALAARLLVWSQLGETAFGRNAFLDAGYYRDWAARIAAGDWLGGSEPFFVEPGYLYVLAMLDRLGADVAGVRLVQAFVGAGTAMLAGLLCARLSGNVTAAGMAGLGVALYGPLVHFEGQLLKTTFEVFAATLALVLAVSPRARPLTVGLAAGAALVLKSNFAVVIPLLVVFAAWRAQAGGRGAARAVAWVALGVLPFVVATAARNHVVSGEALVLPWSSGINFYIGNGPEADGLDPTLPFAQAGPSGEGAAGKREAERRAGRPLGYAESSDFWWAETRRSIADDPGRFASLLADKTRLLLHHREFTDNLSFYFVRERIPSLWLLFAGIWLAVPLGVVGVAWAARARTPEALLVAGYLVVQALGVIGFHVLDRYRLAMVPAAIALGAAAIAACYARRGRGWPLLASAAVAGILLAVAVPPPVGRSPQSLAGHHRLLAIDAMERGAFDEAAVELERAVALNPRIQNFHLRLAVARRLAGDAEGAARAESAGLQLDPVRGPLRLGLLLAPHAPEDAARYCLRAAELGDRVGAALHCAGTSLREAGRRNDAEIALQRATEHAPRLFDSWVALGDVRVEIADPDGARAAWERARTLRPDDEGVRQRLAALAPTGPEPTDSLEPVDSLEPADSLAPIDSLEPVDSPEPVDSLGPIDGSEPADGLEPIDRPEPERNESPEPAEGAEAAADAT